MTPARTYMLLLALFTAAPDVKAEPSSVIGKPSALADSAAIVSSEETPNQRRRRLGLPIVESFPAPDYGIKEETPNQRRRRLGKPLPVSTAPTDGGTVEETPNQKRARLLKAASR